MEIAVLCDSFQTELLTVPVPDRNEIKFRTNMRQVLSSLEVGSSLSSSDGFYECFSNVTLGSL